jgi:hypothetical protein
MSSAVVTSSLDAALTALEESLDALAAAAPASGSASGSDSDAEVLAAWVRVERVRRRLDPVEYALIGAVEARGLPFAQGWRNTAGLGRELLRISAGEAAGRVRVAAAVGVRRTLSGEVLDPIYAGLARAGGRGHLRPSRRHDHRHHRAPARAGAGRAGSHDRVDPARARP